MAHEKNLDLLTAAGNFAAERHPELTIRNAAGYGDIINAFMAGAAWQEKQDKKKSYRFKNALAWIITESRDGTLTPGARLHKIASKCVQERIIIG